MRSLLCLIGRHDWRVRRNPEQGGAGAAYQVCARCGREQVGYDSSGGPVPMGG